MPKMTAVFLPGNKQVEVRAVPVPEIGADEVLVEIKASCICRSDLSLYYGNAVISGGDSNQFVCGHEPAGVVVQVGEAVTGFAEGDNVAVYLGVGCGVCEHCRTGHFYLCNTWKCLGFTMDGGNAEFLKVPARNLLKTAKGMSHLAAAISTDAFGTLFSASRKLGVNGLSRVGIWGMGPMGAAGTLAVKAMGGQVVALDPIKERREFALSLGADLALDPTDPATVDQIREFSAGEGLTEAIDCSGQTAANNTALDALAPMGKLALVGEAASSTIRPSDQLIRKQLTVFGSWYFSINEYADILRLLQTHAIDLERLATHTFALTEAETAFRMFDARETEKAVFVR